LRRFLLTVLAAMQLGTGMVWAGKFEDGVAAYKRGDHGTALSTFRALATQGDVDAQFNLGLMHNKGEGTKQNFAEALSWFRLAAMQGDSKAQYNIGVMYGKGRGTTQDYAEALKWHRMAAVQGNSKAQFNLGLMYFAGHGLAQDDIRAHMWFNLSSASSEEIAAALGRDYAAKNMTPQQVMQAQKMASNCLNSNFKDCE
jgi:uncharacterized protein